MHMNYRFLLILIISFLGSNLYSQWREYNFDVKGPQDGLTTNINDIAQDSFGLIYFATGQGFMRYDGSEFLKYSNNPVDITPVCVSKFIIKDQIKYTSFS